jgi:hypothetical protein
MADLALLATYWLTATPAQQAAVAAGRALSPADVTPTQQVVFAAGYVGGLLLVSAVGVWWLVHLWRGTATALDPAERAPALTPESSRRAAPETR